MRVIMKRRTAGQGMTEYLIIVALIAISTIGLIRITSSSLKIGFGKIANALQGKEKNVGRYEEVNSDDVRGRNMNDFNSGVQKK